VTIEISHYGVCATGGIVNGQCVPAGSILRTTVHVPVGEDVKYLRIDKKLVHHVLDHRRNLNNCREGLCSEIQIEIDRLTGAVS